MNRPELLGSPRYRTVDESRVVGFLLSPYEIAAGRRAADIPKARAVLERCLALGLPHHVTPDGRRFFDPAELVNFIKFAHFKWGETMWMERGVGMLRRLMSEAVPGASAVLPPDIANLPAQRYRARILRHFNLPDRRVGERLRLRLPLPIAGETIGALDIEFLPPDGLPCETRCAPGRLDVVLAVPPSQVVTIGVCCDFTATVTAPNPQARLDPVEAELYTRSAEGLIRVNARVQALSARLSSGVADQTTLVQRFWDYLFDDLDLGFTHYDVLDAQNPLDWTLDHGRYNCQLGAALLAALCRARGIPARLVSGYTLNPVLPTFHTWCEIWFDGQGWRPFDLYSMDLCGGERSNPWRHHYFGRIDHRMVTERPPLLFNGTGAVRLPAAWHMVSATLEPGVITTFEDLATGAMIYSEQAEIAVMASSTATAATSGVDAAL